MTVMAIVTPNRDFGRFAGAMLADHDQRIAVFRDRAERELVSCG
jgi:hypothetical protein